MATAIKTEALTSYVSLVSGMRDTAKALNVSMPKGGDCVPTAIAALYVARYGVRSEFAYAWACAKLKAAGAFHPKSGCSMVQAYTMLKSDGFKLDTRCADYGHKAGGKYGRIPRDWASFIKAERNYKTGCYLMVTSQHCGALIDGTVLDWGKGRRLRVLEFTKVTW